MDGLFLTLVHRRPSLTSLGDVHSVNIPQDAQQPSAGVHHFLTSVSLFIVPDNWSLVVLNLSIPLKQHYFAGRVPLIRKKKDIQFWARNRLKMWFVKVDFLVFDHSTKN